MKLISISERKWSHFAGAVIASTVPLICMISSAQIASSGSRFEQPSFFDHSFESVAPSATSAAEATLIQQALLATANQDPLETADLLNQFVLENPGSVWSPSLRANLGKFYEKEGRYTLAFSHWEQLWEQTKAAPSGPAKRLADYSLAQWTRLLALLGRMDELQAIFTETEGRVLDGGPMAQKFIRTKEIYGILLYSQSASYRCGWLTLNELSEHIRGKYLDARSGQLLYQDQNLFRSCSLAALAQVATEDQWPMIGIARPEGVDELPIPSLVHLKQGHYVALLGRVGSLVLACDPVFGRRLFKPEVLNAESSGRFLVPMNQVPTGWAVLSDDQMANTVGRSNPVPGYADKNDSWCDSCNTCTAGSPPVLATIS